MQIKEGMDKFYIGESETNPNAEITFQHSGGNLSVDHTYVSDELRGQGIAGQLVERVILHAEQNNKKIIPVCSYVKTYVERHKEHHHIIAE